MTSIPERERNEWFCERVRQHLPELYSTARRLARNDADTEDLVGEAVASAWIHLDDLDDPAAFRGWIFRILTNAFLSLQRRRMAAEIATPVFRPADPGIRVPRRCPAGERSLPACSLWNL